MYITLTEEEFNLLKHSHPEYQKLKQDFEDLSLKYNQLNDLYSRLLVFGVVQSNEKLKRSKYDTIWIFIQHN